MTASVSPIVNVKSPQLDPLHPVIQTIIKKSLLQRDLVGRWEFTMPIDRPTAQLMLEHTDDQQRRLAKTRATQILRDIDNGRWENTGDPFRFSTNGTLIDGQHRLTALLHSANKNFVIQDATVIILKDRKALDVVDTGKSRTVSDVRRMTGRDYLPARAIGGVMFEHRNFDQRSVLSKIERNDIVDACPYLDEVRMLASNHGTTPVIAAAIRCMRVDKDLALKFFLAAVKNVHEIDGVYVSSLKVLSTWLLTNKHSGGGHAIRRETVARCIHAWNAFRDGNREVKYLRYTKAAKIPTAR